MAVDGSLVFNTKIDTDGFEKDADKVSSKFVNLKNKIANTEAEISRLTQELEEMANTPIDSGITKKLERDIEKAKIKLNELYAEADRIGDSKKTDLTDMGVGTEHLDEILGRDESWLKVQSQIDSAEAKLRQYETELRKVKTAENQDTGKDTAEYRKKQQRISELNGKLEVYQVQLRETQQKENQTKNSTKKTSNALKSFSKGLNSVISRLGKTAKSFTSFAKKGVTKATSSLKKLTSSARKSNSQMSGLGRTLNSLKGMLLSMVFFNVISGVMNSMTESMGQMSKESTSVNKKLSALQTSFKYLKNSIASAFMPILNVVTPILTNFMDLVSGVTNKVANFIAVLTGQSSYQKAIKVQQDYAESLDDTAKEAEKATNSLASFDELNVMQDNSSSTSSSTGTSTEDYFQSVPTVFDDFANKLKKAIKKGDFESIGELVANKFNKALKSIKWNKIRSTCKSWAKNTVSFLNGFIKKADWKLVGKTFGNGINTIIDGGYEFVVNFKWVKFGKGIREGIVSTLETIDFNKAIDTFSGGINGIIDSAIAFVGTPNFYELGEKVEEGLTIALKQIEWGDISTLFNLLFFGSLDFGNGFISSIDWDGFGVSLRESVKAFFEKKPLQSLIGLVGNCFTGLITSGVELLKDGEIGKTLGTEVGECINNFFGDKDFWGKAGKLLSNAVLTLENFLINAIYEIDGKKIGDAFSEFFSNLDWQVIMLNLASLIALSFTKAIETAINSVFTSNKDLPTKDIDITSGWSKFYRGDDGEIYQEYVSGQVGNIKGWGKYKTIIAKLGKEAGEAYSAGGADGLKAYIDENPDVMTKIYENYGKKGGIAYITGGLDALVDYINGNETTEKTKKGSKTLTDKLIAGLKDNISKKTSEIEKQGTKISDNLVNGTNGKGTGERIIEATTEGINSGISKKRSELETSAKEIGNILDVGESVGSNWGNKFMESFANAIKSQKIIGNIETTFNTSFSNFNVRNAGKIPKYATGTVVPASYGEFLAVLGDNKKEPEVVSPLSTMKQAVAEVLAEIGGFGGDININFVADLDGDKVFNKMVTYNNRYKKRHGKSAM